MKSASSVLIFIALTSFIYSMSMTVLPSLIINILVDIDCRLPFIEWATGFKIEYRESINNKVKYKI